MYLQRLNYLSVMYKVDGVYTDNTLQAVRRFQVCKLVRLMSRTVYVGEAKQVQLPSCVIQFKQLYKVYTVWCDVAETFPETLTLTIPLTRFTGCRNTCSESIIFFVYFLKLIFWKQAIYEGQASL